MMSSRLIRSVPAAGFAVLLLAAPFRPLTAMPGTQVTDTVAKPAGSPRRPSVFKAVAKKLADTLGTVGAAKLIDQGLGSRGKGLGQMLGVGGGASPCGQGAGLGAGLIPGGTPGLATAGSKLVGIAKKAARKPEADTAGAAPAANPCPQQVPVDAAAAMQAAAAAGAMPTGPPAGGVMPGGMANAALMATPLGMAVTAAPLAAAGLGAAAKGMKKLFGGGPQSAMGMLKDVEGKGHLVLKGVRFVAHTEVLDEGYEVPLATLGEALGQVPGPYALYIEPEADKGAEPDRALAAKRVAKIWATLVASGVPAKVFLAGVVVPDSLVKGRKPAKPGNASVELWKVTVPQ